MNNHFSVNLVILHPSIPMVGLIVISKQVLLQDISEFFVLVVSLINITLVFFPSVRAHEYHHQSCTLVPRFSFCLFVCLLLRL